MRGKVDESRLIDKVRIAEVTQIVFLVPSFIWRFFAATWTTRSISDDDRVDRSAALNPRSLLSLSWATKPLWNPTNSIAVASAFVRGEVFGRRQRLPVCSAQQWSDVCRLFGLICNVALFISTNFICSPSL